MIGRRFLSESGYRPMSAFVVIACVMVWVAIAVADVTLAGERSDERWVDEPGLAPAYDIVDARGRTAARFVERFDLVVSPRSMWLAHTPDHMAFVIAAALDDGYDVRDADALLRRMLPDATEGVIEVSGLSLTPKQATAVLAWRASGAGEGPPLNGIDVALDAEAGAPPSYKLVWQPAVLLSKEERELHGERRPSRWTRRLLDGLSVCLNTPGRAVVAGATDPLKPEANEACRKFLWERLMPTGHCVAVEGVPPHKKLALEALLRKEGVSPLQMRLVHGRDRRAPFGEGAAAAPEILGSWGRIRGDETEDQPRSGLELLCERLLADGVSLRPPAASAYRFLVHRNQSLGRTRYFLGWSEGEEPPCVETTLDLDLQRELRRELSRVMAKHEPALAMAIALDLESGDVLAADSVEKYAVQPFAPVYYAFTPGSTFKMVTMATALEAGVVRPESTFDVGHGHYRLEGSSRVIHEAEGSKTGVITARESFAFSVNAGLVQIGQRVDAELFRARVRALGYAAFPGAGLGREHPGYVPPLPWKKNWTHASISFGHELLTTLWQHAAGLAAIARGGVWKPLNLVRAVEQDGKRVELPRAAGERVFSADACATVRDMMRTGAEIGTGRHIARRGVAMGTKTGTAEKVATEVCAHLAGEARAAFKRDGREFTEADFKALRGQPRPHPRSCYTSSMCVVGSLEEGGREIMVLVVVDEPTGKEKYGSKVAGPAASAILAAALGLTREGRPLTPVDANGFAPSASEERNDDPEPWRSR